MKFKKIVKEIEEKPPKALAKLSLFFFVVSCLVGFSAGLIFREFRLNRLSAQQKSLATHVDSDIRGLFEKYSSK